MEEFIKKIIEANASNPNVNWRMQLPTIENMLSDFSEDIKSAFNAFKPEYCPNFTAGNCRFLYDVYTQINGYKNYLMNADTSGNDIVLNKLEKLLSLLKSVNQGFDKDKTERNELKLI